MPAALSISMPAAGNGDVRRPVRAGVFGSSLRRGLGANAGGGRAGVFAAYSTKPLAPSRAAGLRGGWKSEVIPAKDLQGQCVIGCERD